jgi:hypothetical protein
MIICTSRRKMVVSNFILLEKEVMKSFEPLYIQCNQRLRR